MFLVYVSTILALILVLGLISVNFLYTGDKRRLYRILTAVDLIIILGVIGGFVIRAHLPNKAVDFLGSFATVFLISQLACGGMVIVALIIRALYRKFHKPTKFSPARRRALKWGLLYPIMSLAITLYGNRIERFNFVDRFFDIPIKNLPLELDGFKIAQISDIHLGAYFSLEQLENLLKRVAEAKPDLLAITGDIFDDNSINDKAIQLVNSFCDKFKHGIYYIHGNHEHFRGIQHIEAELAKTKIHWLVNQSANVTSNFYVLGVDYPSGAPIMKSGGRDDLDEYFYRQMREFIERARANVPADATMILLAHHPEFFDAAVEKKIPLTLMGHTHGEQLGIFGKAIFNVFKYSRGMFEQDDCYGYVSVGCGSWFPIRIGCPPEIAYFTLTNKI